MKYDLGRPGRHFQGVAELRLYLKIWKGKSILRGRNFRKGCYKRAVDDRKIEWLQKKKKKKVVKKFGT